MPTDERKTAAALVNASHALDAALIALQDAAGAAPSPVASAAGAVDLARARRAGGVLLQALQRGALNDGAMASLASALAAHASAARVAQVQSAIADFDFDLAMGHLQTVLSVLGADAEAGAAADALEPLHDELHELST